MPEGTFRWFSEEMGHGLIRPDDGRRDLFVGRRGIASGEAGSLDTGDEVTYEVYQGSNGMQATNVSRRRRRYSWRDDCRERLEGKEARHEYYAHLDERSRRGLEVDRA
jgi:CspA family cold shock protein